MAAGKTENLQAMHFSHFPVLRKDGKPVSEGKLFQFLGSKLSPNEGKNLGSDSPNRLVFVLTKNLFFFVRKFKIILLKMKTTIISLNCQRIFPVENPPPEKSNPTSGGVECDRNFTSNKSSSPPRKILSCADKKGARSPQVQIAHLSSSFPSSFPPCLHYR